VNQWKRLCPLLVSVAHGGCLQRPVEAFHQTTGCRMVGGCPGELNSTHSGQEVDESRLELTSLVSGDGLRATEAGYPAVNEGACHVSAVMSGMGIASGQRVKRSTAVGQYV
jgi:hypothetical protein